MRNPTTILLAFICIFYLENGQAQKAFEHDSNKSTTSVSLHILGTAQDAGSPQLNCNKECCVNLFENPDADRKVVALGLLDSENQKTYMFEATPDIATQMKILTAYETKSDAKLVDGIFLTHAHIGHYTGLMYLGKEAMDARNTPVYIMPSMKKFLSENGPWNQLIERKNILLRELENEKAVRLSASVEVTPIVVPHRDEYSETVGYRIKGPRKSALFIPDIDKWEKWDKDIIEEIRNVDYAFLDATFYSAKEIDTRNINEIPHPFVIESFKKFDGLPKNEKNKIIFIHFNHTNPLLNADSEERNYVIQKGYRVGKIRDVFEL